MDSTCAVLHNPVNNIELCQPWIEGFFESDSNWQALKFLKPDWSPWPRSTFGWFCTYKTSFSTTNTTLLSTTPGYILQQIMDINVYHLCKLSASRGIFDILCGFVELVDLEIIALQKRFSLLSASALCPLERNFWRDLHQTPDHLWRICSRVIGM